MKTVSIVAGQSGRWRYIYVDGKYFEDAAETITEETWLRLLEKAGVKTATATIADEPDDDLDERAEDAAARITAR